MPSIDCLRSVPVERTARVLQVEGMFDVPPTQVSAVRWTARLPIEERDWNIGLIVGPSGSGKTTLAAELFPTEVGKSFDWPAEQCILDAFPVGMSVKEITLLLSSVGFASPPSWLRPFHVLSNGEQFRVTMARALAESGHADATASLEQPVVVIDEFTSVVDRTVAKVASAAIAKTVRRRGQRLVALSCHYDVLDWLDPDWIYEPGADSFQWRCERRGTPNVHLTVRRVHHHAWRLFRQHHYLSGSLNHTAKCFLALCEGRPAAFTAVLPFAHPTRSGWREHRTVCLPDFQGVGIGNAMSDYVASLFRASGRPYFSTTSNPAMIHRRARSARWKMKRSPGRMRSSQQITPNKKLRAMKRTSSSNRITASFEYVGPQREEDARGFAIVPSLN